MVYIRQEWWLVVAFSSFCGLVVDIFSEKDGIVLFLLSCRSETRRKRSQESPLCSLCQFYPWRKPKIFTKIQVRHWRGRWRRARYALLGSWWSRSRLANRWQSSCLKTYLERSEYFFGLGELDECLESVGQFDDDGLCSTWDKKYNLSSGTGLGPLHMCNYLNSISLILL